MPSSTTSPSTWLNTGVCVASSSSVRKTRPGRDRVDRWVATEHGADLHRGGLGAQHDAGVGGPDPERVLHGARRVVRAEVEGVEVEPLRLDLGAVGDLVAHRDEQLRDALLDGRQRMAGTGRTAVPRQRDVDRLLDEDPLVALVLQDGLASGQCLGDGSPRGADPLAGLGLRGWRQGADLAVGQRQRRPVPGMVEPGPLELVEVTGSRDRCEGSVAGAVDLFGVQRCHLHGVEGLVGCGHGIGSVGQRLATRATLVMRFWSRHRRASLGGVAGAGRPPTPQSRNSGVPAGNTNRNSPPPPGAWPTWMRPPCASTRPRTM